MKRLSLLHRFYSALRGEKLFSSSPGHRVSHSRQVVDLPILHFAEPDSFTFEPLVLDVSHLGMGFRLKQWGYTEPDRELWFHHTIKEAVAIDALGPNAVMDSWQGPRRSYQVVRSFLGGVELVAVLSAMDGQEALSLLKRLFRSWLIAPWPGGMTPSRRRTCTFWRHFSAA